MAAYLIYRFGPKDKPQFRKESFSAEPKAVIRACSLLATGDSGHFLVEDDNGQVVTNDPDIRTRRKVTPALTR